MGKIIAIYKPPGPTSHDIVNQIRRITGIKKVGHAGTLDPLASGVLIIGIGREATRQLHQHEKQEKEYQAVIKLGANSTTDDAEGQKEKITVKKKPVVKEIEKILTQFVGKIKQTPPAYSAIKVKGQKAYRLARRGQRFKLQPRIVEIKGIKLLKYSWPQMTINVICGPGTYIRSLARDLGQRLQTGAYLESLERTRIGKLTKTQSLTLEQFSQLWQKQSQ